MQVRVIVHKKQVKQARFETPALRFVISLEEKGSTVLLRTWAFKLCWQEETNTRTLLTYLVPIQSIWVLFTQTRQKSLGIYFFVGRYHLNYIEAEMKRGMKQASEKRKRQHIRPSQKNACRSLWGNLTSNLGISKAYSNVFGGKIVEI